MLSWGEPRAFWFTLVIIPIIFFYFLGMRFRRQPVSSIYIWSRLQMTSRGAKKLRYWSVLLLLIQVLAAAAVMTLARPAWVAQRLEQPGMVYILDVSASMSAQDVEGGRLAQAKSILEERWKSFPPIPRSLSIWPVPRLNNYPPLLLLTGRPRRQRNKTRRLLPDLRGEYRYIFRGRQNLFCYKSSAGGPHFVGGQREPLFKGRSERSGSGSDRSSGSQ